MNSSFAYVSVLGVMCSFCLAEQLNVQCQPNPSDVWEAFIYEILRLFTSCSCRSYYKISMKSPSRNQRFHGALL